jgi:hypothetical protein
MTERGGPGVGRVRSGESQTKLAGDPLELVGPREFPAEEIQVERGEDRGYRPADQGEQENDERHEADCVAASGTSFPACPEALRAFQNFVGRPEGTAAPSAGLLVLWRWGRVELPVQGLRADRVYERSRRFFVSRNEARTDTLLVLARSVYLSPPTDRWVGRSSAYIALPDPRSGDREDVSLTRQRERKKCWQLSACRSD